MSPVSPESMQNSANIIRENIITCHEIMDDIVGTAQDTDKSMPMINLSLSGALNIMYEKSGMLRDRLIDLRSTIGQL